MPKMRSMIWIISIIAGLYVLFSLLIYYQQERLIFFPERLPDSHRFAFPQSFEETSIRTEDGVTLNALWFKAEPRSQGVVLYFHGNAGSIDNWGIMAESFVARGYDCFMPDYRGYGKSGGQISEQGLYKDAEAAYAFAKQHYAPENIIICGRSLGSGIAAWLAARQPCRKLLLETPYYSFSSMGKERFRFFPVDWLLRYHLSTARWMDHIEVPVVAIHGTQDELIPVHQARKLAREYFIKKDELFLIKGAHHNDLQEYKAYGEALDQILKPADS